MTWDYRRYLDGDDPDRPESPERRPAPGKVSLTSSLRPGPRSIDRSEGAFASEYLAFPVQRKSSPGHADDAFAWDSWNESSSQRLQSIAAEGVSSPAGSLPYVEQIQRSFGRHDITHVEAHVGGAAAESSAAMGATAFATGNHVAFAKPPDVHTAAHEAAHVVQQRAGVQLKGGVGEIGDTYEQHADAVADKVVAGESAESLLDQFASTSSSSRSHTSVQRAESKNAPEAAFLGQLRAESIVQTPRPLRLEAGKAGTVHILPKSEQALPANAPQIPLFCKLLDKTGQSVAEAPGRWHPTFVVGTTFSLTVPPTGARQIELHVNAGRPGARVLTRALEIESEETDREKAGVEREAIKTKLLGLEDAYRDYLSYQDARGTARMADAEFRADFQSVADNQGRDLEILLKRHGFASLKEFEAFIHKFETAFETEAVNITNDILLQYKARLEADAAHFRDPAQISQLHAQLGEFRYQHGELEKYGNISNAYTRDSERARLPGQGQLQPKIGPAEQRVAYEKAIQAQNDAKESLASLAQQYSIFDEGDLTVDHRINKPALARADEKHLAALLQAHVARRLKDVSEAQAKVKGKPRLIYQMDKLMPQFYARQGVSPGSIYDLIIKDKIKRDESKRLVLGIVLSVVAIAVSVATAGSATPAIAAAGAGVGAGLGAYGVYTEYKSYEEQQDLADVGFADDPSTAWLMLAILGAGVDAGAAVKSMRALAPAARALHASGDVDAFAEAVKALEKSQAIEARIARTAEKAAEAKKAASDAWAAALNEYSKKVGSNGGGIFDKDVLRLLKQVITQKSKHGFYTFQMFIDELRQARATLKLAEMTPEELASVKRMWAEALEEGETSSSVTSPTHSLGNQADMAEKVRPHAESTQEILKRHGGSVRKALADLNGKGFTQEEMVEALTEMYRASGRDIGGTARLEDGTVVLISRRVGPDQPVNIIRPNGHAEFGSAEVYIDVSRGVDQPIRVRNVKGASGDSLPAESTSAPTRANARADAAPLKSRDERLAELALDPDTGKVTKATRREAEVALSLEEQGRLPGPVRRPKRGDGHSGDFVDGKGRDWDHKRPRTRQVLHKEIAEDKALAGKPPPRFDPDRPMKGEYDLETTLAEIRGEIASGEGILLDLSGLDSASEEELREAIALHGLESHVIYFP